MPDALTPPPKTDAPATATAMPEAIVQVAPLRAALGFVRSIVERRNIIPALSRMLVRAIPARGEDAAYLELTTTDVDMELSRRVPASVTAGFTALLDPAVLGKILLALPRLSDLIIAYDPTARKWTLTAPDVRMQVTIHDELCVDDFPRLTAPDTPPNKIDPRALAGCLARCLSFVSTEETRYYLNGVHLHHRLDQPGRVLAAATDGHRLISAGFDAAITLDRNGIIIPRKSVVAIQSLLMGADEAVWRMHGTDHRGPVSITLPDGARIITKLIDGAFPHYERVIPTGPFVTVTLRRPDLLRAVRLASAPCTCRHTWQILLEGGADEPIRVTTHAGAHTAGIASTQVPAQPHPPLPQVSVNGRLLLDLLDALGGDSLTLHHTGGGAAMIFTAPDSTDRALLMPMRL